MLLDFPKDATPKPSPALARQERAKALCARFQGLKRHRMLWESLWQEIREMVRPNTSDFLARLTAGSLRKERVFDDFPGFALMTLASGLHSYVTSPSSRWFELTTRHATIDRGDAAGRWLEEASNTIYDAMLVPECGFHSALHELYMELGAFGTGVLLLEEGPGKRLVAKCLPLAECFISENRSGVVDTLYREFELSARAMEEMFGDDTPAKCRDERDPDRLFKIIHAVEPRQDGNGWRSSYLTPEGEMIRAGRMSKFPYVVVRWAKLAGETYGRSPAMDCLQHVRVLNECTRIMLQASQLASAPPLIVDDDGVFAKITLRPWAVWHKTPGSRIEPLALNPQLAVNLDLINRLHDLIGRTFLNDLFNMPNFGSRDRVTAQEIVETKDDRLRQLSPILGRLEQEFLNPIIIRFFEHYSETGAIPEPPASLREKPLSIAYLSPAARAQRGQKALRMQAFLQQVVPYLQIMPNVLNAIDTEGVIEDLALAAEVSRLRLRTRAEREALAKQQQDAQVQQLQMQQLQGMGGAARALRDVAAARADMPELANLMS